MAALLKPMWLSLIWANVKSAFGRTSPLFKPPVVLSISWLMPKDFIKPPLIIQRTPVPAQAMHLINTALSMASSFSGRWVAAGSDLSFSISFLKQKKPIPRPFGNILHHPGQVLDERRAGCRRFFYFYISND